MEKRTVIKADDLCIGYHTHRGERRVAEHLSFSLLAGELTSLIGANGAGKSTLLRTLSAAQPALGGELMLMGRPLSGYSAKELSRTVGVVLTDKTQAGGLTVYELVGLGRQPHTGFFGRLNQHDHAVIGEALEAVGIAHKAQSYAAELSDGERQKAMIAKALVQECPIIILDEPTAFLDVVSRIEIMTLLHRLAAEQDKAILLSTHDLEQALVLSDRLWLLSPEGKLQCGVTEDLVMSHQMDGLFGRNDIRFDYQHGAYYPLVSCQRQIVVRSPDETLLHWTVNALNRLGYACMTESNDATLPHLETLSPTRLVFTSQGESRTLTSFEELMQTL